MLTVRVYTQPACPQCNATKARLDKAGIPYETAEIDDNVREAAISLGITSAPIVVAETSISKWQWGGYSPDKIDALKALL